MAAPTDGINFSPQESQCGSDTTSSLFPPVIYRRGAGARAVPLLGKDRSSLYHSHAMRVLFITATRIGDAVLSTGVLSHLVEC
jgi:hypothetical protein